MDDDLNVSVESQPPETPAPETPPATPPVETPELELPPFSLDFGATPESSPRTASADEPGVTAPVQITDDDIAKFLSGKSHDDLKHIPAYNKTLQRSISKYREEQERAAQENYQLAQWDQYFRTLHPAQLAQVREDPNYDSIYVKVREWRQAGGPQGGISRKALAQDMMNNLRNYFAQDDRFSKVVEDWDELMNEPDLGNFMAKVIETGTKKREKELEKQAKVAAQAYINDVLAKRGITLPSPTTSSSAPQAGAGGLTYESYIKMTPEQAMKVDPQEIDRVMAEHRARR